MAPEYMTEPLNEAEDGSLASDVAERVLGVPADVVAIGPGLGSGADVRHLVMRLLESSGAPLVLDADALNAFAEHPSLLRGREGLDVIITPHPGEMARLVGMPVADVQRNRIQIARAFASSHQVYVVLKGHRTVVATPEGVVSVNLTGNPGMATGGSGDVLTGMIAAWFAQLLDADAAACLGVYLHGLAGDLADADEGEQALTASDIVGHLGDAVLDLTARHRRRGGPPLTPQ
jgi:NAD(P)H-hydrate epimerase